MIRYLFLLLGISLSVMSCREPGLRPTNCRDGKCTYTFQINSRLRVLPPVNRVVVAEGENRVFLYKYVQDESPQVFDDEYTEYIYFELDQDLTEFSLSDSAMLDANLVFYPDCECINDIVPIVDGTLSGKKLSSSRWEVTFDVQFMWGSGLQERNFTAEFALEEE